MFSTKEVRTLICAAISLIHCNKTKIPLAIARSRQSVFLKLINCELEPGHQVFSPQVGVALEHAELFVTGDRGDGHQVQSLLKQP